MSGDQFYVPDESELMAFFGSEPIERVVEDGYWCYEVASAHGMTLRFSLNLFERSVQTEHRIGVSPITTTSHELATRLTIQGSKLRCEFLGADCRTTLSIDSDHDYSVMWSTLRTA